MYRRLLCLACVCNVLLPRVFPSTDDADDTSYLFLLVILPTVLFVAQHDVLSPRRPSPVPSSLTRPRLGERRPRAHLPITDSVPRPTSLEWSAPRRPRHAVEWSGVVLDNRDTREVESPTPRTTRSKGTAATAFEVASSSELGSRVNRWGIKPSPVPPREGRWCWPRTPPAGSRDSSDEWQTPRSTESRAPTDRGGERSPSSDVGTLWFRASPFALVQKKKERKEGRRMQQKSSKQPAS